MALDLSSMTNGLNTAGQPTATPGAGMGGLLGSLGGQTDPLTAEAQKLLAAGQPTYLPSGQSNVAQGGGERSGQFPFAAPQIPQNLVPNFATILARLLHLQQQQPAGALGQTSLGRM